MKFKREHKLKLISFLLALTLWYFVVLGKPIEKKIEVPIIYKSSNADYLVEINPSNIAMKIETTRRVLRTFSESNLKLEINLSRYSPGVYQIRAPIEKLNLPSDIKIKEISPDSLTVVIKKIEIKKVPVKPSYLQENIPFKKFTLTIKPAYVTIKAPAEVLINIHYLPTEPLNIVKLRLIKEIEAEIIPPPGVISIIPKKVKIIYKEKEGV